MSQDKWTKTQETSRNPQQATKEALLDAHKELSYRIATTDDTVSGGSETLDYCHDMLQDIEAEMLKRMTS